MTGVELILSGSFTTQLTVTNGSDASSTGTVKTEMYMTVWDPGYFINRVPNPAAPAAPLNAQLDFFSTAYSYSLGAGGSIVPPVLNSTSAGSTYDNWYFDANTLGEFTGPGNISLSAQTLTGTSLNNTGGNTTSTQVTDGKLSIGIRYQDTPSGDVPEPFTMALMGSGLALLGLGGRNCLTR